MKPHRFQVHNTTIYPLYTVLCVYHPKSVMNKVEIWVPVTTKVKCVRQMLVQMKEILLRCCVIWKDGRFQPGSPSPLWPWK